MVYHDDEVDLEEEDLVELDEEDGHGVVVELVVFHQRSQQVLISELKLHQFSFQPGDGRFSENEILLCKVLRRGELTEEHDHLSELEPLDRLLEKLVSAGEDLELMDCCDEQVQDENQTSTLGDLRRTGLRADPGSARTGEEGLNQNHRQLLQQK